jgi:hypothetical protein
MICSSDDPTTTNTKNPIRSGPTRSDDLLSRGRGLRVVPYERTSGWSRKASEAELKGVVVGY